MKKILLDAIEGEEKRNPLTDEKLMELLNEKGYNIARIPARRVINSDASKRHSINEIIVTNY